jgi:hypothetical protein
MPLIQTVTAHVGATGATGQHQRVSAAAAASLGSLCSGSAVPKLTGPNLGEIRYPMAVTLQVEAGQANTVYYTVDGTTPTATLGFVVPVAPAQLTLPYPDQLRNSGTVSATNQQIQLFAASGTNVQVLFEYW